MTRLERPSHVAPGTLCIFNLFYCNVFYDRHPHGIAGATWPMTSETLDKDLLWPKY
jgi:hypothetical protein